MFRQKLSRRSNNSITWSNATGVMYILTGKYQGAFCCCPYSVESLLNFMFSFKHEISV